MSFNRRRFLTGVLGAAGVTALAQGPLRRFVRADDTAFKRLLVVYVPNGTIESEHRPVGTERDFTFGRLLAPLEDYKSRMTVFGPTRYPCPTWPGGQVTYAIRANCGIGIHVPAPDGSPSGGHSLAKTLTGIAPLPAADNPANEGLGGGISVDQHIAAQIGGDTPFRSLQLGVRSGGSDLAGYCISYSGAGAPLQPQNDPNAAFDEIFRGVSADPMAMVDPAEELRRARRTSVLDVARREVVGLRSRASASDRRMLDAHESAIRDLERRLVPTVRPATCAPPTLDRTTIASAVRENWDTYDLLPTLADAQTRMVAAAFGCDLTRVATLTFGNAASNARHPFVDAPNWHHSDSHDVHYDGDTRDPDGLTPFVHGEYVDRSGVAHPSPGLEGFLRTGEWHATQLANLCAQLDALPDFGGTTVLDNTLILVVNELSEPGFHTHQNMPYYTIGGGQGVFDGYFDTGRYLRYDARPHNDLLVSVMNAMGVAGETFGDPTYCTGPLLEMLGAG